MTLSISRVSRILNSPGLSLVLVGFFVLAFVSLVLALSGVAPMERSALFSRAPWVHPCTWDMF